MIKLKMKINDSKNSTTQKFGVAEPKVRSAVDKSNQFLLIFDGFDEKSGWIHCCCRVYAL